MTDNTGVGDKYSDSCKKDFWQKVFDKELQYLASELKGCRDLLSVGCGPADIEAKLVELGFNVTGLDVSEECLRCAPDSIRKVAGRAEDMPFPPKSFDAAIYVASMQFIDNYAEAVNKTANVLRDGGKLIVLMLNPESEYFKNRVQNPESYVSKVKHTDMISIVYAIAKQFSVETEYFLGIKGEELFDTSDDTAAALFVVKGTKF